MLNVKQQFTEEDQVCRLIWWCWSSVHCQGASRKSTITFRQRCSSLYEVYAPLKCCSWVLAGKLVKFGSFSYIIWLCCWAKIDEAALCANASYCSIYRQDSAMSICPMKIPQLCWWMSGEMNIKRLIFWGDMGWVPDGGVFPYRTDYSKETYSFSIWRNLAS